MIEQSPGVRTLEASRAGRSVVLNLVAVVSLLACLAGACSKNPVSASPGSAPPQISCPVVGPITASTPQPVIFSAPAVSGGEQPVNVTCTPASGATFPVGTTTVTCNALDSRQRPASCSFTITISAPPQLSLTKFLAFGDSLTYGEDGQNDPNATPLSLSIRPYVKVATPYPDALANVLKADYPLQAGQFVVDREGQRGEAAGDLDSFHSSPAVARFGYLIRRGTSNGGVPYNAALIWEGANDVEQIPDDAGAEERALSALRSMIDYAKQYNVRPYLATLTPQNPNGDPDRTRGWAYVKQFNGDLAALAQSEGITLVDLYSNVDLSLVAPDGLHLIQNGYYKVAQVFLDTLGSTARASASTMPVRSASSPVRK